MNVESRQTVPYFCMMDADALRTVATDLSLSALVPHLPRIQHYYRTQEHRDPFRFELCLLEAVAAHAKRAPSALRISSLTAHEELLRAFRDACRQWEVLGERIPPSLYDLMRISGRYLARTGITPPHAAFRATTHAQHALTPTGSGALTLSLSGTTATVSPAPLPPLPQAGVLLLFSPAAHAAAAYADFVAEHAHLGISPIAAIGSEGVLPHLLATNGATLDLTPFMEEDAAKLPVSLGAHTLLLAAPEGSLQALFSRGLPLSLLGTLNQTKRLAFVYSGQTLTAPTLGLLRTLREERVQSVTYTAKSEEGTVPLPRITESEDTLLGGIETCTDSANAVLALATELARRGAIFTDCSACALLEYPTSTGEEHIGRALALVLGLHRATCELALPTASVSLLSSDVDKPRLSVFLAAQKGAPHPMETPTDWQDARDHFYGD